MIFKQKDNISVGSLVRHIEDEDLTFFGPGVVIEKFVVSPASSWVIKVKWQRKINKSLYPVELFTIDGVVKLV